METETYAPMCTDCGERDCAKPDECRSEPEQPVGWLFHTGNGFAVKCHGCAAKGLPCGVPQDKASMTARGYTGIYLVNIYPYRQSCFDCTVTIVTGNPKMCELFTGE